MTPEDATNVMPPMNNAGITPQPRINAVIAPGGNVSARFNSPARIELRRAASSSDAEYSSPTRNNSRIRPISLPVSTNDAVAPSGSRPPSPNARPASR